MFLFVILIHFRTLACNTSVFMILEFVVRYTRVLLSE